MKFVWWPRKKGWIFSLWSWGQVEPPPAFLAFLLLFCLLEILSSHLPRLYNAGQTKDRARYFSFSGLKVRRTKEKQNKTEPNQKEKKEIKKRKEKKTRFVFVAFRRKNPFMFHNFSSFRLSPVRPTKVWSYTIPREEENEIKHFNPCQLDYQIRNLWVS